MINFRLTAAALAPVLLALPATAQAQEADDGWTLHGSSRVRYEALDGQFRPGQDDKDDIVSLRTQLFAGYRTGPLSFAVELYDSRAYDADAQNVSTSIVNAFEPVQAYVAADLGEAFGDGTEAALKAGRFTMDIGSRRIVADDTYRNTTNGFTGVKLDLGKTDGPSGTLFFTLPQNRLPDDVASLLDNEVELDRESFDTIFYGGMATLPKLIGGATAELGYFRLRERDSDDRATRNRRLHTLNAGLVKKPAANRLDYEVEGAYQFGSIRASSAPAAATLDVGAWFLHAEAGMQLPGAWKPRISVEYDIASGDGPGAGYGRYDTLFGSRSGDFGPSGIFGALNRTNISSPGVRFEATPSDRLDFYAVYRAVWLEDATDALGNTGVRDPSGASGTFAGHQIEARVRYWLVPEHLRLEANAAWLAKAGVLEDAPNAPLGGDTHYGAIALTASF